MPKLPVVHDASLLDPSLLEPLNEEVAEEAAAEQQRLNQLVDARFVTRTFRIHRNTLDRWIAADLFPRPLRLGAGQCLRWRLRTILEYIKQESKKAQAR
jgi:predicted DNA-binding transcriptional regulator AlpA